MNAIWLILSQGIFALAVLALLAVFTVVLGVRSVRRNRANDLLALAPIWVVTLFLAGRALQYARMWIADEAGMGVATMIMYTRSLAAIVVMIQVGLALTLVALVFALCASPRGRALRGAFAGLALFGVSLLEVMRRPIVELLNRWIGGA